MGQNLKNCLIAHARELGFAVVRVTTPDRIGEAGARLRAFLAEGRHGDMIWMETTADRRADPRVLWPDVRSIVMLGFNYAPDHDPLSGLENPLLGVISRYAQSKDYHDIIKGRLKQLASWLAREAGADVKVFVDTAPLMEKPLAAAAGIGWQGKHTNLVSRTFGSWLFLGSILTTAELPTDEPEQDHCGSCRRCLDACPTRAFSAPYQLDARRCIAYLTIEHKGHIAEEFRIPMGNRVFGCDDCLAVCPWNKFARVSREIQPYLRLEASDAPLAEFLQLDDAAFRKRFAGTPVKRTGRDRFVRNALIAAGNSGQPDFVVYVEPLLSDPSPLVRAMAVWAAWRLTDQETFRRLRLRFAGNEADPVVRTEWERSPRAGNSQSHPVNARLTTADHQFIDPPR